MSSRRYSRTRVMGVLNVTPDSFSDGGKYVTKAAAVRRALAMAAEGADIIDVGGESTRPGAKSVSAAEEIRRVVPVIEALQGVLDIDISVDTRKSEVARAALKAGARMVNDVSGCDGDPGIARAAAEYGAFLLLMHMKGTPRMMQRRPAYRDVVAEIRASLKDSVGRAMRAGVRREKIIVDPGIGFGKTIRHNLIILNRLAEFATLGFPVCVGTSRKAFIGVITGVREPFARQAGSIATYAIAIANGASIVRVHDVAEARQAATIADSIVRERVTV